MMKILFAEDDAILRKHIHYLLTQAGYYVTLATNGEDAYDLALHETFDVIILDWLMPKKSGIAVCRALRQANHTAGIIMLTAKGEDEDIISGLDEGADDYLIKPFKTNILLARIRAVSRRKPKSVITTLHCKDLLLNAQAHTLHKNNKQIELTKNEFLLLHYLMSNQNHVLTREQIINYVWHFEQDVSNNALDALIKLVRKKIDDEHTSYIQTVRGVGYKM